MNDDIQLPPLPPKPPVVDGDAAMLAYGRACYKAGLVIGERRAEQAKPAKPAKPKVHSRTLRLTNDGTIYREHENVTAVAVVTLRWTDDGRAWIDSGRNRELAARMRAAAGRGFTSPTYTDLLDVADALDGGGR